MSQSDPKVVPFGYGNRTTLDITRQRIISECRTVFSRHYSAIHQEFFDRVDDELFSLSDKAESSSLQSLYFEAMRFVRKERQSIEDSLQDAILKTYDDFWRNGIPAEQEAPVAECDEDSFSLVENEVLEEDLAVTTMIDKGVKNLHSELYGLNRRFAALLTLEDMDSEYNPVGPAQVCYAFERVVKPLMLDLKIKLIIYKLYDRLVVCRLGPTYQELNKAMVAHDVLPKLSRNVKRNEMPPGLPLSSAEQSGADSTFEEEVVDEVQTFNNLQSLLGSWRTQQGIAPATGPGGALLTGPVYQQADVLGALSVLQVNNSNQMVPVDQTGSALKAFLSSELTNLNAENKTRPMGAAEEDVIDMVGLIFDFILEDRNLPDAIKVLIGRLQIPVVKVAIIDRGLFARKTHVARRLLNSIAKAGADLDDQSCVNNPVFVEIESIVNRILAEFDNNIELFAELLEEFTGFMEKDEQRSRIIEDRTRQVTESKEQLNLAKSKVIYELAKSMQGRELPVLVKSFLTETWKDVMVLAYLRRDKESVGWENAFDLVNRLIWSVTPPQDQQEKQTVIREIPKLIKEIRSGLDNISFDPHKTTGFLKDLEGCHIEALNSVGKEVPRASVKPASRDEGPVSGIAGEAEAGETAGKDGVLNPEMAAEIEAMADGLLDLDDALFTVVSQQSEGQADSMENCAVAGLDPADEFVRAAEALEVGQWVTFDSGEGEIQKAKLSWKSQVTSRYVFVNRKGVKIAEKSLKDLGEDLKKGMVTIMEQTRVPVMDRALAAMMATLKPVEAEAPVCV